MARLFILSTLAFTTTALTTFQPALAKTSDNNRHQAHKMPKNSDIKSKAHKQIENNASDPDADALSIAKNTQTALVVTASRSPEKADQVSSQVTVLDKAAIDHSQGMAISDILARTPGVSVTRNGGYGTATSVFIRGAESGQTMLVIDGVRMTDAASTNNGYDFGTLMTGDTSRIEVLRGSQSILWGSQAIGGVVNVVTAMPTKPLGGSVDLETGSHSTINARAAVGGSSDRITWRLAGNNFYTKGISAISPRYGGHENDGYHNRSATGRVNIKLVDQVSVDLRGYYSKAMTDLDSSYGTPDTSDYENKEQWMGYAGLNVALFDNRLRNRFGYSYTNTKRSDISPSYEPYNTQTFLGNGHTRRLEYQGSLALVKNWDLIFGYENEHSAMRSSSPAYGDTITKGSMDINSVYGQLKGKIIKGFSVDGGVRYDHRSQFGGNVLFSGGGVWAFNHDNTVFRAHYGQGFNAPSLYQLYSEYGDQNLKAEKSHGWDAGFEQRFFHKRLTLAADYFQRTSNNLIAYLSCPYFGDLPAICYTPNTTIPRYGYYANINRSVAHGVEVSASLDIKRITLSGNYTWTSAKDHSAGYDYGYQLPRRPKNTANGSADYHWKFGLVTGIAVRWASKSWDTVHGEYSLNPAINHGYTLYDLRAEMPVTKNLTLFGRVENLSNKYYETAYRYGTLGRTFYGGIRARL
ncbi:TonB-dependent receptor plug domain-containing protein [Zymomonas mobilis]|uniref:TonB-dependent receptor n=1 Tax=Zymomonas mobilis subsp. pomaceae (strain ATCC 29192 / DSM 22645 / JCM 10191 / CCUG 17912 / NBRC 13757 / NCIMB 11200 / NRRL B-4491 / Barker I) TaxID=579138 RepID=F8EUI5_ZYMMT|nr:TonB-dependent receptor [Zymomonas mobilis]AEI37201.1 TonB-dependent receptor [Zymomonas mobilis subsp. pomaceae ATCC 29192]MDX5948571.1 TonB-dependent receptor [Zymomonas mobilis subsp. pomaceae]GEB88377.1 TonB-dependent receptor [Zymomonas mobilis subsp. pomaceae]